MKRTVLMTLMALFCCCDTRSFYFFHETQNTANTEEVINMLGIINKTLSHLSRMSLTSIVVELQIVIAKANLEYLLENMDPEVERTKVEPPILELNKKLDAALNGFRVQYVTPDVAKSMKVFTFYQKRFKAMLTPLAIGLIDYRHPLTIEDFAYKKLVVEQENLYNRTDRCLQKLLHHGNEIVTNNRKCNVDVVCYEYFTKRDKYAIFLVQAGLYITVARYFGCEPKQAEEDLIKLCEYMYAEMLTIEQYNFPAHFSEVFGLQMSFCGTVGFGEFIKPRWMRKLLSFEETPGFYRNPLSANKDEGILSAEVIGCVALYIRAMLETDPYNRITTYGNESSFGI